MAVPAIRYPSVLTVVALSASHRRLVQHADTWRPRLQKKLEGLGYPKTTGHDAPRGRLNAKRAAVALDPGSPTWASRGRKGL